MTHMAFCVYKYFPFGGLQRDFVRIADACIARGATIDAYAMEWQGELPSFARWADSARNSDGEAHASGRAPMTISLLPQKGLSNVSRYRRFHRAVRNHWHHGEAQIVVGFNKIPGIDVYYAADPCFVERAESRRWWHRLTPRHRHFADAERRLFAHDGAARILALSEEQKRGYQAVYGVDEHRFELLPPGIDRSRQAGPLAARQRAAIRNEFAVADNQWLLLMVGSGFATKGLDRSIRALAALPTALRERCHLLAVGQDNGKRFLQLADSLGVRRQVQVVPGRHDVPALLQGADVLVHPAYRETAGMILVEAVVAGLPVVTTDVCGYARYVRDADAGVVLQSPFELPALTAALEHMLQPKVLDQWRGNGIRFGRCADVYDLPQRAAEAILNVAEASGRPRNLPHDEPRDTRL